MFLKYVRLLRWACWRPWTSFNFWLNAICQGKHVSGQEIWPRGPLSDSQNGYCTQCSIVVVWTFSFPSVQVKRSDFGKMVKCREVKRVLEIKVSFVRPWTAWMSWSVIIIISIVMTCQESWISARNWAFRSIRLIRCIFKWGHVPLGKDWSRVTVGVIQAFP